MAYHALKKDSGRVTGSQSAIGTSNYWRKYSRYPVCDCTRLHPINLALRPPGITEQNVFSSKTRPCSGIFPLLPHPQILALPLNYELHLCNPDLHVMRTKNYSKSPYTLCIIEWPGTIHSYYFIARPHVEATQRAIHCYSNSVRYDTIEEFNVDSKAEYTA